MASHALEPLLLLKMGCSASCRSFVRFMKVLRPESTLISSGNGPDSCSGQGLWSSKNAQLSVLPLACTDSAAVNKSLSISFPL